MSEPIIDVLENVDLWFELLPQKLKYDIVFKYCDVCEEPICVESTSPEGLEKWKQLHYFCLDAEVLV